MPVLFFRTYNCPLADVRASMNISFYHHYKIGWLAELSKLKRLESKNLLEPLEKLVGIRFNERMRLKCLICKQYAVGYGFIS